MSDEIGSIHRLRVVDFDSKINLSEETFKINDTVHAKNTQEKLKLKPQRCMKIQSIKSDTALWSSSVNNAVISVLEKTCPFKKPLHKRSVSINDLKQKPWSNNLVFSERIKRTFKSTASQTPKKNKRKVNQKFKPYNELSNNNKLQVLFTKNLTNKIRNRSFYRECRRLDLCYDSKSSVDFFGLNPNNNYCKSRSCYHLLSSQSGRRFPPCHYNCRNYRQDDDCFKKSFKEDVKSYIASSYAYTIPIHYNLEFPYDFEPYDTVEPRTFQLCGDETNRNEPCSYFVHEHISVMSSCFSTDGDCLFDSQCILNPSIEIQSDEINIKRNQGRILKHGDCTGFIKPISLRIITLAEKPLSLAKATLEYILFVLAVIAWSPCIITLCLYLLIIYPLRPQNIFKDFNGTEDVCCQCGSCFKCKYNFFLSIFRCFVGVCRKVRYAHNALYSFIKEKKTFIYPCPCLSRIYSYRQPRCKQGRQNYPNPKNKYVLYHSSRRGWLMKPIRKSVKKKYYQSHFMNFQFRQKEFRNLSKARKEHNDCACDIIEFENKSSKQMSIHEMPKREYCDLFRELKCRKRFEDLPPCMYATKYETFIKSPKKAHEKVFFEENRPSPPLSMCDPLHYTPYQRQMDKFGKLTSGSSRPCCHQKKQNLKTKGNKVRPSALNYELYGSKGQKLSSNNLRICCLCQSVPQNVKGTVKNLGSRSWKCDICDHIMCAHTTRKRPYFWIYRLCFSFYQYFLIIHRFLKKFFHTLMLMFSVCIWCPLMCCSYIFYSLCCRCFIYGIFIV